MEFNDSTDVATPKASGYLQQLCKHFGHKCEVEFAPESGSIAFDFGRAQMDASGDVLTIRVEALSEEDLTRIKRVMGSHLERFAFREELKVSWE